MGEPLSVRTQQKDGGEHVAFGHFLDSEEVPVEHMFEAVAIGELRGDLAVAEPQ